MRKIPTLVAVIFFISCLVFPLFSFESGSINVQIELVYPDSRANRSVLQDLFDEAAYVFPVLYGDENELHFADNSKASDYQVNLTAYDADSTQYISLSMTRNSDRRQSEPFMIMDDWRQLGADYISRVIFYLISSLDEFQPSGDALVPTLLDRFTLEYLRFSDLPYSPYLSPMSAALRSNGNTVIGAQSLAIEFDDAFRMVDVIGKETIQSGSQSDFYDIAITPSDILYSRPVQGTYVNRYTPGNIRPERIVSPIPYAMDFTVLTDGTIAVSDVSQPRIFLVEGRQQRSLDVLGNSYISPSAMASGPSGELWIYNPGNGFVEIYSTDGQQLQTLLPVLPVTERYTVKHINPSSDGSFLLMTQKSLYRFSPNGEMLWRMDGTPGSASTDFTLAFGLTFNENNGEIVIPMSSYNYILRFVDTDYLERNGKASHPHMEISAYTQALATDPYDSEAAENLALYHENQGAFELASYYWNQVLVSEPGHTTASEHLQHIEISLLIEQAQILHNQVIETLERLGPESARDQYRRTIALYEEILFSQSDNSEVRLSKQRLEERFARESAAPAGRTHPLELQQVALPDVFPSLVNSYGLNGWGNITLFNPHENEAEDIHIEIFIPGFMDFPTSIDVEQNLGAGQSSEIDIYPVFGERLQELEEDIVSQANIEVSFNLDGSPQSQQSNHRIQLHRRTAISWDDSAKLASFIVPNEQNIQNFALQISGGQSYRDLTPGNYNIQDRFFRAMRLVDAIGSRGIEYVEDPASPISSILGRQDIVDTVRFPRTTLYYQSGDCDDTTALLNSVLEAAGIRSAIVTSPGHVFAAFDSGEPEENAWLFESEDTKVFLHEGTVWIPIETTTMKEGFYQSWIQASELLSAHQSAGEIEFIPVYQARALYPPMPMPAADYNILPPSPNLVGEMVAGSTRGFVNSAFTAQRDSLQSQLSRTSGRTEVRLLNRLGALYVTFDEDTEAERVLRRAVELNDANVLGYLYLTNLFIEQGRYDEAVSISRTGLQQRPDSVYLLLGQAIAYHHLNRGSSAELNLREISSIDPELAERYAYLNSGNDSATRAGVEEPPLIWPSEDDGAR